MSDVPGEAVAQASPGRELPRRQRVAAYAVIVRDAEILLARLAPYLVDDEQWTLPGGGIEFGEDPRDAVLREVYEETGLDVQVGDRAWVDSVRRSTSAQRTDGATDTHAIRLVYEGWAPLDCPEPRVVEEDGSTVDARWVPLAAVLDGSWPVVGWVRSAIEEHVAHRVQRLAVKAWVRRGPQDSPEILLARLSRFAVEAGHWTLPGGGVDHGERPAEALVREMAEETGLVAEVGDLIGVHDLHLTGTAPNGRHEDFHAVNLIFAVTVPEGTEPRVVETDGTTDAVAWIPVGDIASGVVTVTEVVRHALGSAP